jgi:hypothetical protein
MLDIQQPSSGTWLKPAEINGHLLLVLELYRVETRYDQMAQRDKEFAEFRMIDFDAATIEPTTVLDSHPGIIGKIRSLVPGQAVLGRIIQVPGRQASPAWVLGEFQPGVDDVRVKQWLDANPGAVASAGGTRQSAPIARGGGALAAPVHGTPAQNGPANQAAEIEALKARLAAAQQQ